MFRRLLTVLLLAMTWLSGAALADERIGAFLIVDGVTDAIGLVDEIGVNSPLDFRRAMQKRPDAKTVILASPGGMVASALIIAQDVHARGIGTYIPGDAKCYSACSYIFLAGKSRVADGELGVHQMASETPDSAGLQVTISDLLDTLLEFDTPQEVITRMLRTPSDSMYVFSPEEIVSLGINRLAEEDEPNDLPSQAQPSLPPPPPDDIIVSKEPRVAVYEGLDFYGADLSSGHAQNLAECTRACLGDNLCRALTYNADPKIKTGPNCFIKSSVGRLEGYRFAISGLILRDEKAPTFKLGVIDPTVDVRQDAIVDGPPILGAGSFSSLGDCRKACVDDDRCVAFSYRSAKKICSMMEKVFATSRASGYTSGVKRFLTFEATSVIPVP